MDAKHFVNPQPEYKPMAESKYAGTDIPADHPLLKQEITTIAVLKAAEFGQTVTREQAEAVIKSMVWMEISLRNWKRK